MTDSFARARPAADVNTVSWTSVGGVNHVVLADDDSSSYTRFNTATIGPTSVLSFTIGPLTLEDTDHLTFLQPWVRMSIVSPNVVDVLVQVYNATTAKRLADQTVRVEAPGSVYYLLPSVSWPDGTRFTADDLATMLFQIFVTGVDGTTVDELHIEAAGLDMDYNAAPTVDLTADVLEPHPAQIRHSFVYADAESDLQERIQDRIYKEVGPWPTGDGDTQIAALDAQERVPLFEEELLTNLAQTSQVVMPPSGIYRRFVRAADEGSGQRFGAWDWIAFTMLTPAASRPKLPRFSADPDSTHARVRLNITSVTTDASGNVPGLLGYAPDSYEIQRSVDNGVTWVAVPTTLTSTLKGTVPTVLQAGVYTTFYDRFAPREHDLLYRVRSVVTGNATNTSYSPDTHTSEWVTSGPVRLRSNGRSWLQAIGDDNDGPLDLSFHHAGTTFERSSSEQQSAFYAEGRAEPIVFSGTVHLDTGQIALALKTEAEWVSFQALRELHGKMLLRTLYGEGPLIDLWVKLGSPLGQTLVGGYSIMRNGQVRRLTIPYYEVDAP